jgi:hypothetical protein
LDDSVIVGHNVPQLFDIIEAELASRAGHLEKLKHTLMAMQAAPDVFDKGNLIKVATVYQRRAAESEALKKDLSAIQLLYNTTVKTLELRIQKKAKLLAKVDEDHGVLSKEQELCDYFAEEQAMLATGLAETKDKLVQMACSKLGPKVLQHMQGHEDGAQDGAFAEGHLLASHEPLTRHHSSRHHSSRHGKRG